MKTNTLNAATLIVAVREFVCWKALSIMKCNFASVVSGSATCMSLVRPRAGLSCSLSFLVSAHHKQIWKCHSLAHIRMTTATAVINPLNNARLRTTSMNPKRKNPSKKDINPVYEKSQYERQWLALQCANLKCDNRRNSETQRVNPIWNTFSNIMAYLLHCLSQ